MKITCPEHGIFFQTPKKHLSSKFGCRSCSIESRNSKRRYSNEEFIRKSISIHGDKYDYSKCNYFNSSSLVDIICKQHGMFTISAANHLHGSCCSICMSIIRSQRVVDKHKAKIIGIFKKVHGDKYDYSLVDYQGMRKKVKIICSKHGIFEQYASYHNGGSGCPYCNESRGEKEIARILNEHNIKYVREKRFEECKFKRSLPFDFYLPSFNTCIEFDGAPHFFPVFGNLETTKVNDKIKTNFCLNNNIKLIRIRYDQNVEKILFKELNCT